MACSTEEDFTCSTTVEVCGSTFTESCSAATGFAICSILLYSWLLWLLWSRGSRSNWDLDWWCRNFIENICLEASKTMLFIRVFEFHYCSKRRSRDGGLCWNGWLYWFGRLYRSLSMQTWTLRVLDLEPLDCKMVILIRVGGRTTHQCNIWESYSCCRGREDLRSRRNLCSTCRTCSFSFDQ